MISGEESDPKYVLGFRAKYLAIAAALFAVSLVLVYYLGNLFVSAHGVNDSGSIYLALNYAGMLSVLIIIFAFLTVAGGFGILVSAISMLSVGQLRLYDDRVEWKRRGNTRELQYSDLSDAYFGYDVMPTGYSASPAGAGGLVAARRIVSFYIGNRRFTFNTRRRPELTSFLESKIPKKNVDVDDDQ